MTLMPPQLIAKGLLPPDTPSTDFRKEAGR